MMYLESTCYPRRRRVAPSTRFGVDHFTSAPIRRRCFVLKQEGVDLINKIGLTDEEKEQGLLREREAFLKL